MEEENYVFPSFSRTVRVPVHLLFFELTEASTAGPLILPGTPLNLGTISCMF